MHRVCLVDHSRSIFSFSLFSFQLTKSKMKRWENRQMNIMNYESGLGRDFVYSGFESLLLFLALLFGFFICFCLYKTYLFKKVSWI